MVRCLPRHNTAQFFLYYFFTCDLRVLQFLSTSTHLLRLVSFFSTMVHCMAHLAAGSFCLLVPSTRARMGFGVTTSVSGFKSRSLGLRSHRAPASRSNSNGVAMVDRPPYVSEPKNRPPCRPPTGRPMKDRKDRKTEKTERQRKKRVSKKTRG